MKFNSVITLFTLLTMLLFTGRASAADWAANFGGQGGNGATAVTIATVHDAAGNTYLTGYFNGTNMTFGSITLTRIGTQDAFLVKLDPSGNVLWAKNFGGNNALVFGQGIAVDGNENVYLAGYFYNANLTTPSLTKIGRYDAFAIKLDSSGATSWANNFGGSGAYAYGYGIAVDGTGNVYLGGEFDSANLTAPALTKIGYQDAFTIKLDNSGATTWAKNFGGGGASAVVQSIAVDDTSNVYLGGRFSVFNLTTPSMTKIGTMDSFAIKLNSNGSTTWAKNFGGSGAYAAAQSIAVDGTGNVYLTGYISANLTTPAMTKIGTSDAFAIKLDNSGTTTWAKNFGGNGATAVGLDVAVDSSGNVYLGGCFYNANLTTPALTKIGTKDAFAIKLDNNGATTWSKNFGGSGASAYGQGITVDGTGNVYLGGYFDSANLTTPILTKIGYSDAFAIKLDNSGTTTWAKGFASTSPSVQGFAIAKDATGNTYLTGSFTSATVTFGSVTLTKVGNKDAFVVKLDPSGTVLWAKNFGGNGAWTNVQGIAVDGSGNVYLGGYFLSGNLTNPVLTKIGTQDAFAIKLDNSGATTWAKNFGGSGASAYGYGIAVDGTGNVYLGGYFSNGNLTTPALTMLGIQDAFAIKLDLSGATIWAKNFGGSVAYAEAKSIAVDGTSNVYLGGYFNNANLTNPVLTKIGTQDAFAIKLDNNGATTWAKNFGGSNAYATGQSIAVDGSGNVYLGGIFDNANLATPALMKNGYEDAFAIKLDNSGAIAWAKNIGGNGAWAYGQGIAVDDIGNVYLGGYFLSGNLTNPVLTKIGYQDAFAIKLDNSGVITWIENFGGSGASAVTQSIAVDGSGDVYLGGYFTYADLTNPVLKKIGDQDAFIIVSHTATVPAPTALSATSISQYSFTANWSSITGVTGYYLDVATDSGFTNFVTNYFNKDVGSITSAAVTGLSGNTTYYYRVRAYNADGTSVNSNTSSVLTLPVNTSLTVTVSSGAGTGGGTVNSVPAGIACSKDSQIGCSQTFNNNETVRITASPDWKSLFGSWTGACASAGNPCILVMDGDKTVGAVFTLNIQAYDPATGQGYATLQDAYDAADTTTTIMAKVYTFVEDLVFGAPKDILLDGGKDHSYANTIGFTSISGSLVIRQGTVTVNSVVIQ